MARVPTSPPLTSVGGAAPVVQSTSAPAEAFGGASARALISLGSSLQQVGGVATEIARKDRIEGNVREAKGIEIDVLNQIRALRWGDDQNPGYLTLRGKAALNARAPYEKALQEAVAKGINNASNSEVGGMLKTTLNARLNTVLNQSAEFNLGKKLEYDRTLSGARMDQAVSETATDFRSDRTLATSIGTIATEIEEAAEREGWDEEIEASKLLQANTTLFNAAVVAALDDGNWLRAQELRSQAKAVPGGVDGSVMAELGRLIDSAQETEVVQMAVQGVIEETGEDQAAGRAFISENYTGEERNAINSLYTTIMAQNSRARAAAEEEMFKSAWDADDIRNISPTDKAELERRGEWPTVVKRHRDRAAGTQPITDDIWLAENFYSKTLDEQRAIPMSEIAKHVSHDKFAEILRERLEGTSPFLSRTESAYITSSLAFAGIKAPISEKDREEIDKFHRSFEKEVAEEAEIKGRSLTEVERRKIIDTLVVKIRTEHPFWPGDAATSAFRLTGEEIIEALTAQKQEDLAKQLGISADQVSQAVAALQKRDIPVTVQNLQRVTNSARRR